MSIVTEEHIRTYRRDGVVCLRGVIDHHWIKVLREAVEEDLANPTEMGKSLNEDGARFFSDLNLWRVNEKVRRFVFDSPLPEAAAKFFGASTVSIYADQLLVKEPGCSTATPWHQDLPYFRCDGDQIGSFWVGLDPVTKASGAVQYVRASHLWPQLYNPTSFSASRVYERHNEYADMPDIDADPEKYEVICYEMEPGDVTFHHARTVHGARGNSSMSTRRRGYSIRYAGDDAICFNRPTTRDFVDPGVPDGAPLRGGIYPVVWPRNMSPDE